MFLEAWFDSPVTLSPAWDVSGGMVLTVLLLCLQPGMFLVAWFDSPVTLSPAWDVSIGMV
jgi:hypothetical protein